MINPLVLSTKKLRFHQLERLMAAHCDVVDYDALQIEIQPFSIPKNPIIGCLAVRMPCAHFWRIQQLLHIKTQSFA